jgi:flagellar biosynthesis/type III secretory pathway protein FliH
MSYIDRGKRAKDWLAGESLSEEYQRGFNKGFEEGYKQGVKNGRRRAKEKPEFLKATGRPKVLRHGVLILEFMDYVDRRSAGSGGRSRPLWRSSSPAR